MERANIIAWQAEHYNAGAMRPSMSRSAPRWDATVRAGDDRGEREREDDATEETLASGRQLLVALAFAQV